MTDWAKWSLLGGAHTSTVASEAREPSGLVARFGIDHWYLSWVD